jgi:hypothetical protein
MRVWVSLGSSRCILNNARQLISGPRFDAYRIGCNSRGPAKDARAGSRPRRTEGKRQSVRFRFDVRIPKGTARWVRGLT